MSKAAPASSVKPLKRPSQARAKFTVQAIYDGFVRIWQRDGWDRLTTRAVALETGISVGTFYEYFPNKLALLSGYVRHSIEVLVAAVEREAVQPVGLPWQQRVHQVVRLMCGVDAPELSWFHPQMLALEAQMAQAKHHRRVQEELEGVWQRVFEACPDLPRHPAQPTVRALHLAVWGGRPMRRGLPGHAFAEMWLVFVVRYRPCWLAAGDARRGRSLGRLRCSAWGRAL